MDLDEYRNWLSKFMNEPATLVKTRDINGNEGMSERAKLLNLSIEQAFRIQQDPLLAKHLVTTIP